MDSDRSSLALLRNEVSELMFGRAMRLSLLIWVLESDDDDFFAALVADDLRLPASNVSQEIERLVQLKMIGLLPQRRGDRAKRFVRLPSPLWEVVMTAKNATDLPSVEFFESDRTNGR